ncbi:MAG: hypothetical protein OXC40_07485 [Proteobacteria bacterium]|nr:hypothetical protein [Pseudomonadota bacterium]
MLMFLRRAVIINGIAITLGLVFSFTVLNFHAVDLFAFSGSDDGVDVDNNDYQFLTTDSEELKQEKAKIDQYNSMDAKSFTTKKVPVSQIYKTTKKYVDIDAELDKYYLEEERKEQVKEKAYREYEKRRYAYYQQYLKNKAKLLKAVEEEIATKINPYTISSDDVKPASLDE